ncbi:unnamed protein product [Thelazia callipaeda]|uniref:Pheromone-regulated membrane protein 10 n=1 Tax=Thelazia callipaeda TaxID=103827 RepID=A0A158RAY8_THECL|nr:unnamed protein product [Thelazia callipaeda]
MGDQSGEESARNSLESLLRSVNNWPVKKVSSLQLDASGDPEPRSLSDLNASLQKLLIDSDSNSITSSSRRLSADVTTSVTDGQQMKESNHDDDFFEMVSRLQSKRLNDQRCDPIILSDLTNHSKNITRQSDTIVHNSGKEEGRYSGSKHRLSSLFGRVGKAARRQSLLMSTSFFPSITSTPRSTISSKKQYILTDESNHRLQSKLQPSPSYLTRTSNPTIPVDENIGSVNDNDTSSTSQVTTSSEFRVPVPPPRNKASRNRALSLNSVSLSHKNGAEGMLDLIASLQGRRMEEQRAHLSVQPESIVLSVPNNSDERSIARKSMGDNAPSSLSDHERTRLEDAGNLYEMVIRSQRGRLEEQRSELPVMPKSIPAEDVSRIVMSMQKGRIETQRAVLNPRPQR